MSIGHLLLGLLVACPVACSRSGAEREVLVAAAASLRDVLAEEVPRFEREHPGVEVTLSFAASSTHARQLEAGARFDLFLSASELDLERLGGRVEERREFLGNRLALVARGAAPGEHGPTVRGPGDLPASAGWIAIAAPEVPAGRYAREWLRGAGILTELEPRLVLGSNVRKTLALVESGAASFGFVYRSDHAASSSTRLLWVAPVDEGPRIRYVAGVLAGASPEARRLADWLQGAAFQEAAAARGFEQVSP